ncbi:transcription factor Tfb2-domain-containing protein [Blastocladiella britannica]|nr:transcription factor Tfb2-domain-containing protein [Blastocladiella britannica]
MAANLPIAPLPPAWSGSASASAIASGNIVQCLLEFPPTTLTQLYTSPATCLAIFRLLPPLAKQLVMRLLLLPHGHAQSELALWAVPGDAPARELESALAALAKFRIATKSARNLWTMDERFRENLLNALTGRGPANSFGVPTTPSNKEEPVNLAKLDDYARNAWETMLQFMVGVSGALKKPPHIVEKMLTDAGLMHADSVTITQHGFQFLLQDVNHQVWSILLQYHKTRCELLQDITSVDLFGFLFLLSSMELGTPYSSENFTHLQAGILEDMWRLGLVYRRNSKSKRFYPTRLATTLTSGKAAISRAAGESDGYIIVETNFRLYAYTSSNLQIATLQQFAEIETQFQNFAMGRLTRDSIKRALEKGIKANQIISFIVTNAHPLMRKQLPVLPMTIADQIRLWELDSDRMAVTRARALKNLNARTVLVLESRLRAIGGWLATVDHSQGEPGTSLPGGLLDQHGLLGKDSSVVAEFARKRTDLLTGKYMLVIAEAAWAAVDPTRRRAADGSTTTAAAGAAPVSGAGTAAPNVGRPPAPFQPSLPMPLVPSSSPSYRAPPPPHSHSSSPAGTSAAASGASGMARQKPPPGGSASGAARPGPGAPQGMGSSGNGGGRQAQQPSGVPPRVSQHQYQPQRSSSPSSSGGNMPGGGGVGRPGAGYHAAGAGAAPATGSRPGTPSAYAQAPLPTAPGIRRAPGPPSGNGRQS